MTTNFQRNVGSSQIVIETGKLAQQANGTVLIRNGDSVVLVTATMNNPREGIDFFPLTIDFEERHYAQGKIPASFFRREGRPSTEGVLTCRLTDRPLRPLFPKDFRNEVQIIGTTLSTDQETPLDILTIIGASAALSISDIPFGGPIGATRIGYINGDFVINPSYEQIQESDMDLVVAGTRDGVLMMEAGGSQLSEETVLEGIKLAQDTNLEVISLQDEMVNKIGKPKVGFESTQSPEGIDAEISGAIGTELDDLLGSTVGKSDQSEKLESLKEEILTKFADKWEHSDISNSFESILEKTFRKRILEKEERPDGRNLKEIRPLDSEVSLLPRTHGSSLFSRGETQILGTATLGSLSDAQRLDTLSPIDKKRFMLHYNFPPYSTGETRFIGSPKRRDIGHGALAERALESVLPSEEDFPYAIRIVAEALSSNGSTSMGSVCAGSLALMDAGVPIKSPVAGISVGLITSEDGSFSTLTDIQGMEDHFGDMDFKVAGTADGINAIQLDIKIPNISFEIIEAALSQAKEGRLVVLDKMAQAISSPRTHVSPHAPRITRISIPVDKIGAVIGPGGKMIRSIIEETGATVDVEDDGTVLIGSTDESAANQAVEIIEGLTKEAKVGDIYTGKVVRILDFGAFIEILPGKDGMVHISELANYRVPRVEDVLQLGEEVTVIVKDIDQSGRIALSRKALLKEDDSNHEDNQSNQDGESGRHGPRSNRPSSGYRRRDRR